MQISKNSIMIVHIHNCVCVCSYTLIISSGLFSTAFSLFRMRLSLVETIDSSRSRYRISISMLMVWRRLETCPTGHPGIYECVGLCSVPMDFELQCPYLLLVRQKALLLSGLRCILGN